MFRVEKLTVKDWCQHRNRTAEFVAGTNGVVGTNGKGKSNLVNALFTAITGRVISDTIEENINFEADKATIEMSFVQDGIKGVVKRGFTATRIDGDPKNRKQSSTTAKLKYGDLEISKTAAVTDELIKITGMRPRVIEDHVFVSQYRMQELLFQRKADRMASFLTLIPGVERAESIRMKLQQELVLYPEVTLALDLNTVQRQLADNLAEYAATQKELVGIDAELTGIKIADILKFENELQVCNNAEHQLTVVNVTINGLEEESTNLVVKQVGIDKQLADALNTVEHKTSSADIARTELSTIEQNKTIYRTRKNATTEFDTLMAEIASKVQPEDNGKPWIRLPELATIQSTVAIEVSEHTKILNLLRLGNTCPTCNQPFQNADDERKKHTELLAPAVKKLQEIQAEIQKLKTMESVYTRSMANYTAWIEQSQARVTSLAATLESLPNVPEPDVARIAQLTLLINEYATAQAKAIPLERESKQIHSTLTAVNSRLETVKEQQAELLVKVSAMPASVVIATNAAAHKRHSELTAKQQVLTGKLLAKKDEQARLEQNILQIEVTLAKTLAVKDYRNLITEVRDILHRDRLPKAVLITYVQELDLLTNKFLSLFGNPFTVTLDQEMDMVCRFAGGYTCGPQRLSGGQKCVLSVAVRFAINELFAKDLGLLVLDEPSAYLDAGNVAYIGELIEHIRSAGKESGVQTIIVTHEVDLISCFENTIAV